MGIELVLPQSRTPAVEKNEILVVIELVLPHSRTPAVEKKKKYYMGIQLVLPQSKKIEILHGYTTSAPAVPHSAHGL